MSEEGGELQALDRCPTTVCIQERSSVVAFSMQDVPPVLRSAKHYLFSVLRAGMFFVAVVGGEAPPLFVLEFVHRVVDTFEYYFGGVSSELITRHFSTTLLVLDEMLDSGYPLLTEPNALVTLIEPPSLGGRVKGFITGKSGISERLGAGALSVIPWRRADVKYTQNEIFFDIHEEIDCIIER